MMQPESQNTKTHLAIECLKAASQYFEVGNYSAALTCFENALDLDPNNHDAWNGRGIALFNLGWLEEAISSWYKALELQPDYYIAHNLGAGLCDLKRYEEAIANFDHALTIKPDDEEAWIGRASAARNSVKGDNLPAFLSTLATQNSVLQQRGYRGGLASLEEGLKYFQKYSEGWGRLHNAIGNAHYLQGQQDPNSRVYWLQAREEYNKAIKTLTAEAFPARHLELLQDVSKVCLALGDNNTALAMRSEGSELLGRLLQDTQSKHRQLAIARQFASFDQLRVYELVQSGNWCAALELAEARKNLCLSWLRYGWSDEPTDSPKYPAIQKLLNFHTAAIYWHVSPAAITTFILRHNQPPQVHSALVTADDVTYPAAARQLRDFENWVKVWKQNYQDYRSTKEKGTEEKLAIVEDKKPVLKDHPWRKEMAAKLEELKNILDIPGILPHLSGIQHLILIPHRDLHLLPLHDLFPEDFTITYLPSAQIGLDLQQPKANPGQRLLNVENPLNDLRYATVESAAISLLYPDSTIPIKGQKATRTQVMTTMQTDEQLGVFHFTGHGQHDINEPLESSLLLAGEEELTLRDIFELDFSRYHLICLSACETALTSKQGLIDEFVGLVSGFLAKGAAYVVSALWAVDEYSTALLMVRFYQYLQENMTPPSALKEAQKWLRTVTHSQLIDWYQSLAAQFEDKNSDIQFYLNRQVKRLQKDSVKIDSDQPLYAHPYYWAGFTVTGKV